MFREQRLLWHVCQHMATAVSIPYEHRLATNYHSTDKYIILRHCLFQIHCYSTNLSQHCLELWNGYTRHLLKTGIPCEIGIKTVHDRCRFCLYSEDFSISAILDIEIITSPWLFTIYTKIPVFPNGK